MIYVRGQPATTTTGPPRATPAGWADVLPYFVRAEHNRKHQRPLHEAGRALQRGDLRRRSASQSFVHAGVQAGYPHRPGLQPGQTRRRGPVPGHPQVVNATAPPEGLPHAAPGLNLVRVTGAQAARVLEHRRAVGVQYRQVGS